MQNKIFEPIIHLELEYFLPPPPKKKIVTKHSEIWFRDPGSKKNPDPDPRVKKAPDPGSATLRLGKTKRKIFIFMLEK